MPDSDVHVYPDDYFNDVDHNHDRTEHFEHDYVHAGAVYEHLGTFNLRSEHDRRVYESVNDRVPNTRSSYHNSPFATFAIVHRRV